MHTLKDLGDFSTQSSLGARACRLEDHRILSLLGMAPPHPCTPSPPITPPHPRTPTGPGRGSWAGTWAASRAATRTQDLGPGPCPGRHPGPGPGAESVNRCSPGLLRLLRSHSRAGPEPLRSGLGAALVARKVPKTISIRGGGGPP